MSGFDPSYVLCLLLAAAPLIAFAGYPLFLWLFSRLRRPLDEPPEPREPAAWPRITMIISAHNEQGIIREKIENALRLDYPRERLEVLVPTDGSTDATDSILSEYAGRGVRALRSGRNRGKTVALGGAIRAAAGDVLVFSDANSLYHPDALRRLARWFQNAAVGCVCGRLVYEGRSEGAAERGEKRYWSWDTRLKQWEGSSGHLLGANGAIFALRRSLAVRLPGGQSNDMVLPIIARLRGFLTVFEPDAVASEATADSVRGEFRRKMRIIARGLNGVAFSFAFALHDPASRRVSILSRAFVLFQVTCKKLFRYLTFPALACVLALAPLSPHPAARCAGGALWLALALSVAATLVHPWMAPWLRRWPSFKYPLAMAAAACAGFVLFLTGRDVSRWKSQR